MTQPASKRLLTETNAAAGFIKKVERTRPLGITKTLLDNGSHPGFPYAVNAPDGNLLVAWREGANHAPSKGVIKAARYTQSGAVVTASTTILSDATYDARDPGMTVLADGRIALSYFIWDQILEVPILDGMRVMFSSDSGVTWTAPVVVDSAFTTWAAGAGAIVELSNGDLLLPTYGVSAGQTFQHAAVSRSTDGGVTWAPLAVMGNGDTQGGRHYQEPNIILTDKGDLLALMRSDQALAHYAARSSDGGVTWSTPTLAFPGNGSPRITNHAGYLHAVHRHETTGRTVKISSPDSGVTWGDQIVLPVSGSYLISSYGVAVPYGSDSLRYIYAMQISAASDVATGVLLQVDSIVPEDRTAPGPVGCRLKNTASVNINTATWTSITFSAEEFDTDGLHSTATNTSRITIPTGMDGYYNITGTAYFASSTATQIQARLLRNGTAIPGAREKKNPTSGQDAMATVSSGTIYLAAGNYIEMQCYQDSGGALSIRFEDTVLSAMLTSPAI